MFTLNQLLVIRESLQQYVEFMEGYGVVYEEDEKRFKQTLKAVNEEIDRILKTMPEDDNLPF